MDTPKKRILVVEDDEENQVFMKFLLHKYYELTLCNSGDGMEKLLSEKPYDIIIMDISLKGAKDGLQLTSELKADPKYKHIPVICLTAHALKRDRENALKAGVDYFVTKPVKNKVLLEIILEFSKN